MSSWGVGFSQNNRSSWELIAYLKKFGEYIFGDIVIVIFFFFQFGELIAYLKNLGEFYLKPKCLKFQN